MKMQTPQTHAMVTGRRPYDRDSNVLIVDDDSTLLKFFKIHLNKFFSRVVVVENAKAALETMKEREIDLVLTDIRMPKIDGLELMQKIRKNYPGIPILLISGEPMSDDQAEIVKSADGFLAKPFGIDELNDYICSGIDLRNSVKELLTYMKNPKKIRDAMCSERSELKKFVDKSSLDAARIAHGKIQIYQKKAG
jgi:DNA-binding NtrC family response regulator